MDIVWQRRGMLVSPNTYYQNISILRKGLKKVGFETDPIVTIPRIGTCCSGCRRRDCRPDGPDTPLLAAGRAGAIADAGWRERYQP